MAKVMVLPVDVDVNTVPLVEAYRLNERLVPLESYSCGIDALCREVR